MFDLDLVFDIVESKNPSKVVLQFQDEYLTESITIYKILHSQFGSKGVEFYINADSIWGFSADDISAKHVDGQLILYFGRDMHIGNDTVYFIPFSLPIPLDRVSKLVESVCSVSTRTFVFYESSFMWLAMKLQFLFGYCQLVQSQLMQPPEHTNQEIIAGFYMNNDLLESEDSQLLYLGSNASQLAALAGRFPNRNLFHVDLAAMCVNPYSQGHRILAERYARIEKVEHAEVIGIIVHSMSMTAETTTKLVDSIETMIKQAGKQFYTLVIGRIDESKLENFPEIDLFCLISSDSMDILRNKKIKWRRPILTPFELQVGLGQREWESVLRSDFDIEGIANKNLESPVQALLETQDPEELQLILANQRMLSVMEGKGSTFFADRSFKGLQPVVERPVMEIVPGQFGTASSYVPVRR